VHDDAKYKAEAAIEMIDRFIAKHVPKNWTYNETSILPREQVPLTH
jgi:hypothetical protein